MVAKKATATKKSTAAKAADTKQGAASTKPAKKETATKKATTKKSAKATKKKPSARKATPAKSTASKSTAKKSAKTSVPAQSPAAEQAARLVVREDESPWTAEELTEVRTELVEETQRLRTEISAGETDLSEFLKEPIDGAGDDQADAGSKSFEREHELSLAANARFGLEQNVHALERLEDGSYGICESCGNPVGKLRLQAYPRATLCLACKSRQERR